MSRYVRSITNKLVKNIQYSTSGKQPTSGIIVIGDEILNGEVADTNSTLLAKELYKLGLKLMKISVISDDLKEISDEVRNLSKKYDFILTTGGIGPTHDDLTYAGVAAAFDEPLYLNPDLKEICSEFYMTNDPLAAGMKLAYVPKSSKLHYDTVSGGKLRYPNVSVRNVYMFPGIPELLKHTITEIGPILFKSHKKYFTKWCYCKLPEYKITKQLQQVVDEFPDVKFGCYPKMHHSDYKVKITVKSYCSETTLKAYTRLLELIPIECIANIQDIS